jgi:hypothetical protein
VAAYVSVMGEAVPISAVKWPDKAEDQLNCRHSVAKNLSSMTPEMYKDIKSGIRKRKTGCELALLKEVSSLLDVGVLRHS